MKKALSVFLSALIALAALFLPSDILLAEDEARFEVSSHNILAGQTAEVTVSIKNSPGISAAKISVYYDSDLTLVDVSYNDDLGGMSQAPKKLSSPITLNWISLDEISGDMVFATLTFSTVEDTPLGNKPIDINFESDDIFDIDENNVAFSAISGVVSVVDCLHENTTGYEAVVSTCKTAGHAAYTLCDDCQNVIEGSNEPLLLDPDNHEGPYEVRNDEAPTYIMAGYTGDTYCTACDVMIETGEEIPVLTPIRGDINYDGRIASNDIIELIRIILGISPSTETADIIIDGKVDVVDLVELKYILIDQKLKEDSLS